MIRRFLLKIVVTAGALWVADYFLAGFTVMDGIRGLLVVGVVLGVLNTFVRPIIKLLTFPLILLTFGFFSAVINAALLWLAADMTGLVAIAGLGPLLWATVIVSLVQGLLRY